MYDISRVLFILRHFQPSLRYSNAAETSILRIFWNKIAPKGFRLVYYADHNNFLFYFIYYFLSLKSRNFWGSEYFWTRSPPRRVRLFDPTDKILILFYSIILLAILYVVEFRKIICRGINMSQSQSNESREQLTTRLALSLRIFPRLWFNHDAN